MTAIEIHELTKRYGTTTALDALTLSVADGEVYGFLGPNGAGKSTTIDVLMDFVRPTSGDVRVLGFDPRDDVVEVHRRVGILPDRFQVYDRLTGRAHLEYVIDSKSADDDPATLLERVGLADAGDQRASDYSRGMQQRLALAMALVGEPDLLILDEPFSGLDPHGARRIREIVYEENERGATVFFSSHVLGQVEFVCDRIGILDEGRLLAEGTIDGLRERAGVQSTLRFPLSPTEIDDSRLDRLAEIDGVTAVDSARDQISVRTDSPEARLPVVQHLASSSDVDRFSIREPSVEDIFVSYTDAQ
ncbi:ATP-binding cassette domain-containing protein [Natrarchaeobius sp. A-rgal3]|uniref:ABC transporter ATP-binding protein n=1 Tax=Natrarchaeobius versutus TaxID=1679078 RepID=UPI0035109570